MAGPPLAEGPDWRPVAGVAVLRRRAELIARIRAFFAERGVLEVETPLLLSQVAPEDHLDLVVCCQGGGEEQYLASSPETAMKRLLAAGSGPIYQITRSFRSGEAGRRHNPEFTLLEWYRPGYDYRELIAESARLVDLVTGCGPCRVVSYREVFGQLAGVDPWTADEAALARAAGEGAPVGMDRAGWLDWLLVQRVEPGLRAWGGAVAICDYPPDQAAMAEVTGDPYPLARRFELYLDGVELANGYQELTDSVQQAERLAAANRRRAAPVVVDRRFLDALSAGLPRCAGVALGVDRLVMAALRLDSIREVMAFPADRI